MGSRWSDLIFTSTFQVDFQDVDARTLAERKRAEEKQKRLDRIYKERSEQAAREMEGELWGTGVPQRPPAAPSQAELGSPPSSLFSHPRAWSPTERRGERQVGRLAGRSWLRLRAGGGTQPQTPALPSGGQAAGGTLQAIHASPAAPAAVLETCTPRWSAHPMRLTLPHPPSCGLAGLLPRSPPLASPSHEGQPGWEHLGGEAWPQDSRRAGRGGRPGGRCREGGGRPERDGGGVSPRLAALFQKYCPQRLSLGVHRRRRVPSQHESGLRVVPRTS